MIVSLNEIETTARKAAVGAGLPAGAAEDFGAAVRALAENGFAAERHARDALLAFDAGRSAAGAARRTAQGWRLEAPQGARLAVCLAGPAGADLARAFAAETGAPVALASLDVPPIVPGALAAADGGGGSRARSWRVDLPDGAWLVHGPAILPLPTGARAGIAADEVLVQRAGAAELRVADGHVHAPPTGGLSVDAEAWAGLEALCARCLVPASEASRLRGAGAGLLDAD